MDYFTWTAIREEVDTLRRTQSLAGKLTTDRLAALDARLRAIEEKLGIPSPEPALPPSPDVIGALRAMVAESSAQAADGGEPTGSDDEALR